MIFPELRSIESPDLAPPALPTDPGDCIVSFRAVIGPRDDQHEETFSFAVVTPTYLGRTLGHTWGRGYLIVDTFDWQVVVRAIAQLLLQSVRMTWSEVVRELDKELRWEPPEMVDGG